MNKKTLIIIAAVFGVLIVLITVPFLLRTLFMNNNSGNFRDNMDQKQLGLSLPSAEKVEKYLSEKYGEDFKFIEYAGGSRSDCAVAISARYPDDKFLVRLTNEKGDIGIEYAKDGYQMVVAEKLLLRPITEISTEIFTTATVNLEVMSPDSVLVSSDEAFSDNPAGVIHNNGVVVSIVLTVAKVEEMNLFSKDSVVKLANQIIARGYEGDVTILAFRHNSTNPGVDGWEISWIAGDFNNPSTLSRWD